LLCLPVAAPGLISHDVNELLEKSFTQIRDRLRRPLQIDLYNYFCQRCSRLDLIDLVELKRIMTQEYDAGDPCLQERPPASSQHAAPANAAVSNFNALMPIGNREIESRSLLSDPPGYTNNLAQVDNEYGDYSIAEPQMANMFKVLGNQMAKSMSKCYAKMQKQDFNKIAKRIIPDRNNRKENRKTKIGSAFDGFDHMALAAIKPETENEVRLLEQQVMDCHREKISTVPLNFMGAVVKVLTRRDAE
jgi:hypothetical protein